MVKSAFFFFFKKNSLQLTKLFGIKKYVTKNKMTAVCQALSSVPSLAKGKETTNIVFCPCFCFLIIQTWGLWH